MTTLRLAYRSPALALPQVQAQEEEGPALDAAHWRFGLGIQAVRGWAPHKPPEPDGPGLPWDPRAAGLCESRTAAACPEVRLYPEAWAEWIAPRPWGDGSSLSLWAGWRPVPGGPLAGSELSASRRAPAALGWGGSAGLGPAALYERWMLKLEGGLDRYLVGHRMRLQPARALTLWVYEIGVVTGRFLSQAFTWLPFWPMYLTQHLALRSGALSAGNDDANLHIGVAGRLRLGPTGLELAGELFVDDMQQPFKPTPQPDQVGLAVMASWSPSGLPGSSERMEVDYRRVHRFVYTFQRPALSYVHGGLTLGEPDGPDGDHLRFRWSRPGRSPSWVGLEWRRRGPGRLGEVWERRLSGVEARASQFLAGPVEHTLLALVGWEAPFAGAGASVEAASSGSWRLELAAGPVIDVAGEPGRLGWLFQLGMQAHLP